MKAFPPNVQSRREWPTRQRSIAPALCLAALTVMARASCAQPVEPKAVESGVDFQAHVEHGGLVVDRMAGDDPAVLVRRANFYSGGPDFLLQFDDKTVAALWLTDGNHMVVRQSEDPNAPVIGQVEANWQQGAIKLSFQPANGPAFSTGRFHRVDELVGRAALLGPDVSTTFEVQGVYRAEVRDAEGKPIGWLRASIHTPLGSERVYDGVLPPQLDGPLAVAATELVNANVDNVEGRAVNLYQGN